MTPLLSLERAGARSSALFRGFVAGVNRRHAPRERSGARAVLWGRRMAEYLRSLAFFRGVAIVLIVAGHCFALVDWSAERLPEKLLENLVKGSTVLFVFISGFLFHHVFAPKFQLRRFLGKKLRFVLLPYLTLSLAPVVYFVFIEGAGPFSELIYSGRPGLWGEHLQPALMYLWTGRHLLAYWYIPFIMVVFALSPVFLGYLRLPLWARLLIMGATLIVAMLVHRPVKNISVLQSVVYFLPAYLLGMNVSLHKRAVLRRLAGKEPWLALAVIGLASAQLTLYTQYSNLHKQPLEWGGVDILLLQKLIACLLLYALLERLRERELPVLDALASSSFAIFFLHPLLLLGLRRYDTQDWPLFGALPPTLGWLVWVVAVTLACYGVASIIRALLGRYSRYIIGW